MTPGVHILATVRKPALLPAALLVFKTLRTGFPSAPVTVWGNALDAGFARAVSEACAERAAEFKNAAAVSHDRWVECLLAGLNEPFWICDTDIVFWEAVQQWDAPETFAGRFEPDFDEKWMGTRHVARLHTSLMQFNPAPLRAAMRAWACRIPVPWRFSAEFPFVRMHFIPAAGDKPLCYDTCAGLWQAGMGTPFTDAQNAAYEHLHCATYVDAIHTPVGAELLAAHQAIYADYNQARGLREAQLKFYESCGGER